MFQLLLAVSACERPVTPSSTFSMLPSVTSFLRAADNQLSKEILGRAQEKTAVSEENKDEKMETESSAAESKKEKAASLCLFEIDDSEVRKQIVKLPIEKSLQAFSTECQSKPANQSSQSKRTQTMQGTNQNSR